MAKLFESMAEDEVIPCRILAYTLPSGIVLTLWQCEGGLWEIKDNEGRIVADYIVSWSHAVEMWERLVPVRR